MPIEHGEVGGGGGERGDLVLVAGVADALNGKLQHHTVRVLLAQHVDQRAPLLHRDHRIQPRGRLVNQCGCGVSIDTKASSRCAYRYTHVVPCLSAIFYV